MSLNFSEDPHRRYNILTGEWVLVSPHRTKRPWQGKVEKVASNNPPKYDEKCFLCPGNIRANGVQTPNYPSTYAFDNDFGALVSPSNTADYDNGMLKAKGEQGICRVVCFSPDHSLTLPEMEVADIEKVITLWQVQYKELGAKDFINHVQIFENKGSIMGCSNQHPHGQIWAQSSIPLEVLKKSEHQKAYWKKHQKSLLQEYLNQELFLKERIIFENEDFVSLVPFWAVWPYEAMILPKRHLQNINQLTSSERINFAIVLQDLTRRFDLVFDTSFPYSSGIHQQPTDCKAYPEWHFHMSFYPPLLRSATVKKFMVGYEMFGNPQRDITAEMAASTLRGFEVG